MVKFVKVCKHYYLQCSVLNNFTCSPFTIVKIGCVPSLIIPYFLPYSYCPYNALMKDILSI